MSVYAWVRVGEAVQVRVAGGWRWADVVSVQERYRTPTLLDGRRGRPVRIDDRVVLRLRGGSDEISTTPWLMARSIDVRGVQGALW